MPESKRIYHVLVSLALVSAAAAACGGKSEVTGGSGGSASGGAAWGGGAAASSGGFPLLAVGDEFTATCDSDLGQGSVLSKAVEKITCEILVYSSGETVVSARASRDGVTPDYLGVSASYHRQLDPLSETVESSFGVGYCFGSDDANSQEGLPTCHDELLAFERGPTTPTVSGEKEVGSKVRFRLDCPETLTLDLCDDCYSVKRSSFAPTKFEIEARDCVVNYGQ
jgi:hypothetical protein